MTSRKFLPPPPSVTILCPKPYVLVPQTDYHSLCDVIYKCSLKASIENIDQVKGGPLLSPIIYPGSQALFCQELEKLKIYITTVRTKSKYFFEIKTT